MFRLRMFLLCLVMLALPLQGVAAASMALCGTQHQKTEATVPVSHADAATHDHAAHDHGAMQADKNDGAKDVKAPADSLHKCGTCGACGACHNLALTEMPRAAALDPFPQADLAEPSDAIATLPPRVLDKPPRA